MIIVSTDAFKKHRNMSYVIVVASNVWKKVWTGRRCVLVFVAESVAET